MGGGGGGTTPFSISATFLRSAHPFTFTLTFTSTFTFTAAEHNPRCVDGPDWAAKPASAGTRTIEGNLHGRAPAAFAFLWIRVGEGRPLFLAGHG